MLVTLRDPRVKKRTFFNLNDLELCDAFSGNCNFLFSSYQELACIVYLYPSMKEIIALFQ